ncbi:outer dynein arm-docking complex subunit 4-like [Battus philenor]|uniref:outer dynein arm-docking complex subunit 4-like n=1 Tax=Battus philenor TaxID=42288 RepID=UPI0035CFF8DF
MKKLELPEKIVCNAVAVYRERGNYLQRLEQFEKAIVAYDEALRWNNLDVGSLLGRSLARAKATHYSGALADVAQAAELEPKNLRALQIKAQTEYEKCAFERSLVLASRGQSLRVFPPNFAECARCAEETIRECSGLSATKVMKSAITILQGVEVIGNLIDNDDLEPTKIVRRSRMQKEPTRHVQEISRVEKQKSEHISRLMASKYLQQMAHDKHFLVSLCKDERLLSANKQGSQILQELANNARVGIEKCQDALRVRRPLYAARAAEAAARARLSRARKERLGNAQKQHAVDARRLVRIATKMFNEHDTTKCLETAEFAMEQISRKPINLLPDKEIFLLELHNLVANVFLDQKRFKEVMSEEDREKRAFVLLGISVSREPSHDSVLRTRPLAPPRDIRRRLRTLERTLSLNGRASERCFVLHELCRLYVDTKQAHKARFFALKGQSEARLADQRIWLLNITFLLARCHLLQNNRPEARAALIEGGGLARSFGFTDVGAFFDTCVNISGEGEIGSSEALLEKREKEMVNLMQDDDLRSAAKHLFKRMSVIPASRRFSVLPGTHNMEGITASVARRASIVPKSQQPTRITHKFHHPLGFQEFDL